MLSLFRRRLRARPLLPAGNDTRLRPNRDVFSAAQDGITVLLDLRRQVYLGIDEVGTHIWNGIERGASRVEIEQELAAEYEAAPETIRSDTHRFLSELVERGLVVRA